jgi:hypothetical protein
MVILNNMSQSLKSKVWEIGTLCSVELEKSNLSRRSDHRGCEAYSEYVTTLGRRLKYGYYR